MTVAYLHYHKGADETRGCVEGSQTCPTDVPHMYVRQYQLFHIQGKNRSKNASQKS